MRIAIYAGRTLTIEYAGWQVCNVGRFDADRGNFQTRLQERSDLDEFICNLLLTLFQRGLIVQCVITFGSKVEFRLNDPDIYHKNLDDFVAAYKELTGEELRVNWASTGSGGSARSGRRRWGSGSRRGGGDGVGEALKDIISGFFD